MKKNYQIEVGSLEGKARAYLVNQRASLKFSTEACRLIKGKNVNKVLELLKRIENMEQPLPLKRYNTKVAHRKGDAGSNGVKSGRFPVNTVKIFTKLLELVKANADFKGLDSENLIITHTFVSQGFSRVSHQPKGRIAGKRRKRKSVHLEVIVQEGK